MSNITEFKQIHKRFIDGLRYLVENEEKLKADPVRWQKIKTNFEEKFEKPMDEAWQELSQEEREKLAPIYLHGRIQSDPTVKKIIDTFNAKIKSVEKDEGPTN